MEKFISEEIDNYRLTTCDDVGGVEVLVQQLFAESGCSGEVLGTISHLADGQCRSYVDFDGIMQYYQVSCRGNYYYFDECGPETEVLISFSGDPCALSYLDDMLITDLASALNIDSSLVTIQSTTSNGESTDVLFAIAAEISIPEDLQALLSTDIDDILRTIVFSSGNLL